MFFFCRNTGICSVSLSFRRACLQPKRPAPTNSWRCPTVSAKRIRPPSLYQRIPHTCSTCVAKVTTASFHWLLWLSPNRGGQRGQLPFCVSKTAGANNVFCPPRLSCLNMKILITDSVLTNIFAYSWLKSNLSFGSLTAIICPRAKIFPDDPVVGSCRVCWWNFPTILSLEVVVSVDEAFRFCCKIWHKKPCFFRCLADSHCSHVDSLRHELNKLKADKMELLRLNMVRVGDCSRNVFQNFAINDLISTIESWILKKLWKRFQFRAFEVFERRPFQLFRAEKIAQS